MGNTSEPNLNESYKICILWLPRCHHGDHFDLRDKAEMWHFCLCLLIKTVLKDGKRKAAQKRTRNTHVKKEWEHMAGTYSSLSKNKSSGRPKLGAQGLKQHGTCRELQRMRANKRFIQIQQRLNQKRGSKTSSRYQMISYRIRTTSQHALLPTCVFCGCPGFHSTHRGICPLWSTCRDLCRIICPLVFISRKLEPLEMMINECDTIWRRNSVLCIWKTHWKLAVTNEFPKKWECLTDYITFPGCAVTLFSKEVFFHMFP